MAFPTNPWIPPIPPIPLIDFNRELNQRVLDLHLQGTDGPRLLHSGPGSDWIPQGQGHDAGRGEVLSTYNDGGQVLLSFQKIVSECDPATDEVSVILGGDPEDPDAGAPSKGGGVATDGEYIYVADTQEVYVYRRTDVEAALQPEAPRPPLRPDAQPSTSQLLQRPVTPTVEAIARIPIDAGDGNDISASYLTLHDGHLYVGDFTSTGITNTFSGRNDPTRDAELRRYALDPDTGLFDPADYRSIEAPKYAQGAVVTDTGVLFSTSLGSGVTAPADDLVFQPTTDTPATFSTDGDAREVGHLPHYAQGLNVIDGELWVTHESAADKYRDNVDDPLDHIQRYSIDDLGLSPGDLGIDTRG
ncbi:hypothetical protein FQY83_13350 [Luteimonas marina]|uniref:Uncharacterized protein n=1 Tax=Luteimonas marina TaxID=488485 RepID=A0A5C5U0A2_9GAMM|nr:hypothetical protein [Luteimonas marina]TWT19336.1 hypothetical protein FQY83_13350 [Luteimonas marina]